MVDFYDLRGILWGDKMVAEPDPYDVHIAGRIALARNLCGATLLDLAEFLGLSYQQVQKYERGENRVSGGRLFRIAQRYDLPITFFYEGLDQIGANGEPEHTRAALHLVRAFGAIPDANMRTRLSRLCKSLARYSDRAQGVG